MMLMILLCFRQVACFCFVCCCRCPGSTQIVGTWEPGSEEMEKQKGNWDLGNWAIEKVREIKK